MASLPVELLSEIFVHSMPETHSNASIHDSPLLLTRVCRLWRDLAFATPVLWAAFSIELVSDKKILSPNNANLWLSRSQNLPLSIYVEDSSVSEPDLQRWAFYEELCRHAHRWQDVTLNIPFTILWRLPIQHRGALVMLERLKMGRDEGEQYVPDHRVTTFMTAPQLRAVDITLDADQTVNVQGISLPWAQLTVFRGRPFATDECLFVLLQATRLTECEFDDIIEGNSYEYVVAPSLQVLRLDSFPLHTCAPVMSLLTVPTLRKLALGSKTQNAPGDIVWPAFRRFLSRSSCSLTHLLISANTSVSEWDRIMLHYSLFPLLEHLEIFWFHEDSNIVPLIQTSDTGTPLPRLHAIVLHSQTSPKEASLMNIISLLFARTADDWPATSLRRFEYTWDTVLETKYLLDETVRALTRCREILACVPFRFGGSNYSQGHWQPLISYVTVATL
ncbi:F-box domain-containing protein [Mycena indigotica]|uniref:F-box domain-containing protein n=1 Tax=Mycena indigotica TaxID=2126181 RepID=A0A8H6S936_9AGAR|nr:F-box domain-containing protein [Mycena indigotica]KAF7294637.1 F-box domain-containing protein [Mycena indigotica]